MSERVLRVPKEIAVQLGVSVQKAARWRERFLSRDPQFVAKLEAIVGLYWNPPEHALALVVQSL